MGANRTTDFIEVLEGSRRPWATGTGVFQLAEPEPGLHMQVTMDSSIWRIAAAFSAEVPVLPGV